MLSQGGFLMATSKTKVLVMCAMCVALAFVLNKLPMFSMPNGGSVTACSMFFIALAGLWFGPVYGLLSGVVMGLLDLATGGYILNPAQVMLDYILGFGLIGVAGFFRNMKFCMHIGYLVGAFGRFVMVVLSGMWFWETPFVASMAYNISYIGVEVVITLAIISIPAFNDAIKKLPQRLNFFGQAA
jgi:thiamine transporter